MLCLRRSFESIRVVVRGLRRYASVKSHASAFVFEPYHGCVTGENLGHSSSFSHPVCGLVNDRMVFNQRADGVNRVPVGDLLFKLFQIRLTHVRSLAGASRKQNGRLVLAHAGGNV